MSSVCQFYLLLNPLLQCFQQNITFYGSLVYAERIFCTHHTIQCTMEVSRCYKALYVKAVNAEQFRLVGPWQSSDSSSSFHFLLLFLTRNLELIPLDAFAECLATVATTCQEAFLSSAAPFLPDTAEYSCTQYLAVHSGKDTQDFSYCFHDRIFPFYQKKGIITCQAQYLYSLFITLCIKHCCRPSLHMCCL